MGAQGVTPKSKLLAREMPDLHTRLTLEACEIVGSFLARSSGRCAPFTAAQAARASSTSPCRRAGQRDHRPRQAPRYQ